MAFNKRTGAIPHADSDVPTRSFPAIVARPKKAIASGGCLPALYPNDPPPAAIRRLATVASSCGADPSDQAFTVADRLALLRTPTDPDNAQEQRYRNRVRNRGTAITAMCVACQGTRKGVRDCDNTLCPLWAFRFGGNPFHAANKRRWQNGAG